MKSSSSSKKKGTAAATAKKGIKKPAPTKKVPKSKRGGKKPPASAKHVTGNAGGEQPSSDDETDNGPYCLCRGPDDHRWMIGCDVCEDWFHGECVQLDKETGEKLVERFVCPNCTDGRRNYTKYRKTCSLPSCRNPARLYAPDEADRSVFCSADHCDAWWASVIATLPAKAASKKAVEVLTREDFMGLLATTAEEGGWKLGEKPFGRSCPPFDKLFRFKPMSWSSSTSHPTRCVCRPFCMYPSIINLFICHGKKKKSARTPPPPKKETHC